VRRNIGSDRAGRLWVFFCQVEPLGPGRRWANSFCICTYRGLSIRAWLPYLGEGSRYLLPKLAETRSNTPGPCKDPPTDPQPLRTASLDAQASKQPTSTSSNIARLCHSALFIVSRTYQPFIPSFSKTANDLSGARFRPQTIASLIIVNSRQSNLGPPKPLTPSHQYAKLPQTVSVPQNTPITNRLTIMAPPAVRPTIASRAWHAAVPHVARTSVAASSAALSRRDLTVNDAQRVTLGVIAAYVVAIALLWNLPYIKWILWPFKVCKEPLLPSTIPPNNND
jgi:hypothetical protein